MALGGCDVAVRLRDSRSDRWPEARLHVPVPGLPDFGRSECGQTKPQMRLRIVDHATQATIGAHGRSHHPAHLFGKGDRIRSGQRDIGQAAQADGQGLIRRGQRIRPRPTEGA